MPSPRETRAALQLNTTAAIEDAQEVFARSSGSPEQRRLVLLENIPSLVSYYSDGSAALAYDFYQEERELAGARSSFTPEPVVTDRTVKLRSAIAWSAQPLFVDPADLEVAGALVGARLAEVVQLDTARPFRDTIRANRRSDSEAVGWRRVTNGGCKFCRLLADRGAIYRDISANFAAHTNCHCTAQPVFSTNDTGEQVSVMQYLANSRKRSPSQQAQLREYLDSFF